MHGTISDFSRLTAQLDAIQAALREQRLDGWLLFDLHARNPVADWLLGLGDLTRRFFVLIPAAGEPVAITHGIEQQVWQNWPWRRERYSGWSELDDVLRRTLGAQRRVALETSECNRVPAIDFVPAGVVELVRAAGPEVVSSAELITMFYASWSLEQYASHKRASVVLAAVARAAFRRLSEQVREQGAGSEGELRQWVLDELARRGAGVGADSIVANGPNAANPHYGPEGAGAPLRRGDLVLLDLWAKEAEDMIYADQTWMAVLDAQVGEAVQPIWAAVRDARDAAVRFLRESWSAAAPARGFEVDDVARAVIRERGYGEHFIHRTGHSIDRDTHGAGPNIDNYETHEVRRLIPGIGFSIEPGIYLPGSVGMRTELNVFIGSDGPEVTTPDPQRELFTLLEAP
ncbi:MAG: M24 family metallopeptidase [Longimicrobiales bacterium]